MAGQGSKDRLLALGAAFAARLENDTVELRTVASKLESATANERVELLEVMRNIVHRLRGTAPAFDAADIGEAAGSLEIAIVETNGSPGDLTPAVRARFVELLALLDQARGVRGPPRQFLPKLS